MEFKMDDYKGFKLRFCDMVSPCAELSSVHLCTRERASQITVRYKNTATVNE